MPLNPSPVDGKKRCFGGKSGQEFYAEYHDKEWCVPVKDDQTLFEMLILEGAQAGLSWETVLKKRSAYREAFHQFDPERVAKMTDQELEAQLGNPGIIRNRLKVFSSRKNAQAFLAIQEQQGSFSNYLWGFVNHQPILNRWEEFKQVPASTPLSDEISKQLKKRGMTFVGSTIIYAYLQGIGVVNDHLTECWCFEKGRNES